jgi:hypothetical protein
LGDTSAILIGLSPVLIALFVVLTLLTTDIIRSRRYRKGPLRRTQKPVLAYKVATLTRNGFAGVSGGGSYGYLSEGRLNPGFHGFKNLDLLEASGYNGDVVLEVLLYGAVDEYQNGYIGSHQRVLQVAVNQMYGRDRGICSNCGRKSNALAFDRSAYSGYGYSAAAPLYCKTCRKLSRFRALVTFQGSHERGRFEAMEDLVKRANSQSTNKYPVGFVSRLSDLVPTELSENPSAR